MRKDSTLHVYRQSSPGSNKFCYLGTIERVLVQKSSTTYGVFGAEHAPVICAMVRGAWRKVDPSMLSVYLSSGEKAPGDLKEGAKRKSHEAT